jgi:hypothetical protein
MYIVRLEGLKIDRWLEMMMPAYRPVDAKEGKCKVRLRV